MPELKGSKTEQNLRTAFAGETQARTKYDYFASKARKDGYVQISKLFEEPAANEKEHEERYRKLLSNVENGLVFSREGDMVWQCSNCGHIVVGKQAPEVCPVCAHPQSYFQLRAENY